MNKPMEDAMRYISGELRSNPDIDRQQLVTDASQKFNLSPKQTEFLTQKFVVEQ